MAQPLKFYTDENIPSAIAEQLQQRGVDILRCQDADMMGADDPAHLALAAGQGRVLSTWDADFLRLNTDWASEGKTHAGIVYITPNSRPSIGEVVNSLMQLYTKLNADEMLNRVHYI